jgi:lipopolysaccharide transport system ATP-binding protein
MTKISLLDASLTFPILDAGAMSLTNRIVGKTITRRLTGLSSGIVNVRAIEKMSLNVSAGERVGIIGANGAGKTSLLKLISGVYEPSSGSIERVGNIAALTDISLGINSDATGRENIYLRAALLGLSRKEMSHRIDELISFTELEDFIDLPVRVYSSGMQMRLAFAVATSIQADILVMDEWLSVGDESFQLKAKDRLSRLLDASEILFLASHSEELLKSTCTRIIWLERGVLKADGTPEEILPRYFG